MGVGASRHAESLFADFPAPAPSRFQALLSAHLFPDPSHRASIIPSPRLAGNAEPIDLPLAAISRARRRGSGESTVVNNAGMLRPLDLRSGDESVLDEMWAVNVKAPFRPIRLALPHLEKGGRGRIVNVASTDGKRNRPRVSVGYAMTKHAVLALSHAAKFAGWEKGVRVAALCPGAVDTELVASIPGVTPAANRLAPETVAKFGRLPARPSEQRLHLGASDKHSARELDVKLRPRRGGPFHSLGVIDDRRPTRPDPRTKPLWR